LSGAAARADAPARDGGDAVGTVLLAAFAAGLAVSISLAELSLAALAGWLLVTRRLPRRLAAWPLLAPLAAFAAWTVVAALASARPLESLAAAKSLLTLATVWVVLHALRDPAAAQRFATVLLVLLGVVGLLAIVQSAWCPPTPPAWPGLARFFRKCDRARGFYSIYMTLGGVLAMVLVAALPRLALGGRAAVWQAGPWLLGLGALALTRVRGAWLGFAAGALGAALTARRRGLVLGALVAVVALVLAGAPAVRERALRIADPQDDTARDRLAMWRAAIAIAREHPLTGVGPGQVKHVYARYAPPEALRRSTSHVHNTPLQMLAERGVPGLLAWAALFGAFLVRALRLRRALPPAAAEARALVTGGTLGIVAFLVAGLFEHSFGDTEVLLVACTLMGLVLVVARAHEAPRETVEPPA
jgi:O-antigen ligase